MSVIPDYNAMSAAWLYVKNAKKPYLFFGTNKAQILYINLNSPTVRACSILILSVTFPGPISGILMSTFSDDKVALITVSQGLINGFILSKEFTDEPDDKRLTINLPINHQISNAIYTQKPYLAVFCGSMIFCYYINTKTKAPIVTKDLFSRTTPFSISSGTTNFSFFGSVMVHFTKDEIFFFQQDHEDSLYSIKIPNVDIFEMDSATGEIYGFKGDTLVHYQFCSPISASGFDCLLFWLFYSLLAVRKEKEAADVLLLTSISFDQMVKLAHNESDFFRFHLFKEYVNVIQKQYILQRTAIAQFALELYIRIESLKEKPDTNEFIHWLEPLIKEGVIVLPTVEKLCKLYGWEEPLMSILEPPALFNVVMESNSISEAEKILSSIQDPECFSLSALRIFNNCSETIVNLVSGRPDLIIGKMIPVLASKLFMDKIINFFRNHTLKESWIRNLYSIQLSRTNTESEDVMIELVKNLCRKDSNSSKADIDFVVRCLVDEKKYKLAAIGLFEREEYIYASGVSALDPENSLDLIPIDISIDIRRRCALRILRSMKRKEAEQVAKKLLNETSGIDIITILEYLPSDTKIGSLRKIIPIYIDKNMKIAEEQKQKKEEALKGINESNEMVKVKKDQVIMLKSLQTCTKCGKLLLTDGGVVYPCGHAFHENCVRELNNKEKIEENCSDCPMCGFASIKMICQPFDRVPYDKYADIWTVEESELKKLLNRF
ncbi:Pep3p [Histomonas meleagridis]|uniref:Pep3p n=1 Tax=Histomonas meleagridis TaxID=135588 RepID=UPI003559B797|nr:Pep3p [Histomonas meleagridis]KAH0803663.1 Pep3p [Histomonas meleagridis]